MTHYSCGGCLGGIMGLGLIGLGVVLIPFTLTLSILLIPIGMILMLVSKGGG